MRLDSRSVLACYLLLAVAYVGGLMVPLMNNDSAHHAGIALHMHLSGDYLSLVTQGENYLDKPHLLFWLAALGFKVFGVNTFAYKLPSLLFSVLAVYSTARLAALLYSPAAGRLAGLVLASALAFVLANNDVRMDALLTGAIAFSIWQLAEFVARPRWRNLALAALGLALGFSTKGMIGVAMPLIAVFLHLLYRRDWQRLFDPRWLVLGVLTLLLASPVLYAYHHQFGADGVRFILWSQNFERLAGERFGNAGAQDPLFFVHTFLWAFLPWSLLALAALWAHGRRVVAARLRPQAGGELLTLGTLVVLFAIISASRFKLPHYLNILLPLFAVQLAGWLAPRLDAEAGRGLRVAQWVAGALLVTIALALNGWVFPLTSPVVVLGAAALATAGAVLAFRRRGVARVVVATVAVAAVFNFLLNFNFYPRLLGYQAGNQLAAAARELALPVDQIAYLDGYGRANSFDFYTARLTPSVPLAQLQRGEGPRYLYTSAGGRDALTAAGVRYEVLASNPDFRITRLNAQFLDPARRPKTLTEHVLLKVGE
ncbi:hypothetical protein dqs_0820 [Azoarcus olearius]|uniref:ArnT family glycosyltransferase n=1 Tax=Azoarcus sp. (strain BH72) TaxID=418699 RepID=UPI0008061445|nr:glycosyltransferase family 39 protein [Azoarcus olearius]ANQ83890.1 hypothetical protein dqs_0820 [Azoarcus olearius]